MTASEAFAFGAGAVQATVAAVFWYGRRFRAHWGLGWLSFAFAGAGTVNLLAAVMRWDTPDLRSPGYLMAALVGICVMAALVVGVQTFVADRPRRPVVTAFAVALGFVSIGLAGRPLGLGLLSSSVALAAVLLYLAWQCTRAARARTATDAWALLPALLAYPVVVLAGAVLGADPLALRVWGAVPIALLGVSLMVLALWRYHRELHAELALRERAEAELRQLNLSLEQRIEARTEELRDMVGGLESFNRMVSHDLRGPLGGMAGLSQLAQQALDAGDTPRTRRMLDLIHTETRRLVELVNDLLTLARISHAELELHATPLDSVLDEALRSLALSQGGDALRHIVREPLPAARADGRLLCQVFVNLLSNALKFSGERGKVVVRVLQPRAPQQVVVEVCDNGVGFPPERAADLFQPFGRLHGVQYEGTGIGLTIVRRIVERHGGQVWAEGRPGQGSSFYFSLPAV
ncbi:MAG: HAMP domain-containing histidine kinase [Burkholderiales bacterium]|nr:HAMP domain-containing histidine kinase [Burkholderiales bacterium]